MILLSNAQYKKLLSELEIIKSKLDPKPSPGGAIRSKDGLSLRDTVRLLMEDGKMRNIETAYKDVRRSKLCRIRVNRHAVTNELGIMCRDGILERIQEGTYRWKANGQARMHS